jgi:hypothetical protein
LPQLPQFAPSIIVLVHTLLHAAWPVGHAH